MNVVLRLMELMLSLCGGVVGFAQSFSCPTQLQCWGCVVLCCCWGCDNILQNGRKFLWLFMMLVRKKGWGSTLRDVCICLATKVIFLFLVKVNYIKCACQVIILMCSIYFLQLPHLHYNMVWCSLTLAYQGYLISQCEWSALHHTEQNTYFNHRKDEGMECI